MTTIILDNKKYVVVKKEDFEKIQQRAALKTSPVKKMSLSQGKKYAYKLIDEWAKEK